MNKIYRIVFNAVTGRWVVASELATGRKKASSRAASTAAMLTLVVGAMGAFDAMAAAAPNSYSNGIVASGTGSCFSSTNPGVISTSSNDCSSGSGSTQAAMVSYDAAGAWGAYVTVTDPNTVRLGAGGVDKLKITNTGLTVLDTLSMSNKKIASLAAGTLDTDAVNFAQLKAVGQSAANALGTTMASDGTVVAPSYALTNANSIGGTTGAATNVGAGFAKVDAALGTLNTTVNNMTTGGGVKYFHTSSAAADSTATGSNSIAIGPAANAAISNSIAMGVYAKVDSTDSDNAGIAIGMNSHASGTSEAVGYASSATGSRAAAIGSFTTATAAGAVALGNYSVADRAAGIGGSNQGAVSVGSGGSGVATGTRQIISVARGTQDTDATNLSQLKGVATALGGGAAVNADGTIAGPSYALTNANSIGGTTGAATDVGAGLGKVDNALGKLGAAVTRNSTDIAGNTTSISNLQNTVNNISAGTAGLVQQSAAGANLTVGKGTDGVAVDFAGNNGAARKLLNVENGNVVANSKEAVNGGQLDTTNQAVAQNTSAIGVLDGRVTAGEDAITRLDSRVTTNEGDISTLKTDVSTIDNRVTTAEGNINTLNTNLSTMDSRVTNVEGSVSSITNQLNSGEIGLVQYDAAAQSVTVAKGVAGTTVDFRNSAGVSRRLKGVAAGGEDEDAVNVSQLKKVTDAIGGGASVNADGSVTAPTYVVTNADGSKSSVSNMGDAMTNLDGRVYNNTTAISTINQQISSGTIGLVQQAAPGANLTVGKDTDGAAIDVAGTNGARKLVNVADGAVAAGSKEAVNGGQLHAVSQSMASALGGGSVVNADGTVTAPTYSVTNADGSTSQVHGVEGAITNIDNRVTQNTQAIANNTSAISNLSTQISNGEVGLVKQDAASRQITVAKDSDGTSVNVAGTAGDRVVTGVAAAKADNDAVNLGQLKSAGVISANGEAKSVMTYDDAGKTSMTMGGEGASSAVTIHNVADGVADHDAVNVSQLNTRLQQNTTEVLVQANSYTDQKIGDVWTGMDKLATEVAKQDSRISSQGAMSMAEAQMASGAAAAAVGSPNGAWSVGLGSEQGHGAISAGYAKPVGRKSQISFGAAFGGDNRSVGVGFAHRL